MLPQSLIEPFLYEGEHWDEVRHSSEWNIILNGEVKMVNKKIKEKKNNLIFLKKKKWSKLRWKTRAGNKYAFCIYNFFN